MVTIAQVAAQTGLSSKTLSRWVKKGIIPEPCIKTHPSGRGKVGYWPAGVLEKCIRLAELRQDGIKLETACILVVAESLAKQFQQIELPIARKLVAQKDVELPDGQRVNMVQVLLSAVITELQESLLSKDFHEALITKLRVGRHIKQALFLIHGGYNPFFSFDGQEVYVEPDFLLGHHYAATGISPRPVFLLPLLPIYNRLLTSIGAEEFIQDPAVGPAPKAWVRDEDAIVEYEFHLGGPNGFRMIKGCTTEIGQTRKDEHAYGSAKAKQVQSR